MKKAIVLLAAAAMFAALSCSKIENTNPSDEFQEIQVNITVGDPDGAPSTKALKTGWVSGDVLNLWFDSNCDATPNLTLTYNGSAWEASKVSTAILDALKTSGRLKVIWEGNNDLKGKYDAVIDGTSVQFTPKSTTSVARVLAHGNLEYTYTSGTKTLSATINALNSYTAMQVTVPGLSGSGWILTSGQLHALNYFSVNTGSISYSTWYTGYPILGQPGDDGYVFVAAEIPGAYYNAAQTYTFTLTDGVNTYVYTTPLPRSIVLLRGTSVAYPFTAVKLPEFDGEVATPVYWIKQVTP